jgi:hypothetical protein
VKHPLAASLHLTTHGANQPATATITSYHFVFRAAAIFTITAVTAALLFRSGPIPTAPPERTTPTP